MGLAYDFGLPMGPIAMSDMAGLDVSWRIRKRKIKDGLPQGQRYSTIADKICEMGRYGQKTQGGFYHYDEAAGSRSPTPRSTNSSPACRQNWGSSAAKSATTKFVNA